MRVAAVNLWDISSGCITMPEENWCFIGLNPANLHETAEQTPNKFPKTASLTLS